MAQKLTLEQLEKRRSTNKKILKFGCLPILILFIIVVIIFSTRDEQKSESLNVIFNVPKYLSSKSIDTIISDIGEPVLISNEKDIYIFQKGDYRMRVWATKKEMNMNVIFPIYVWKGNEADIIDDAGLKILRKISNADSLSKEWIVIPQLDANNKNLAEISFRKREKGE